MPPEPKNHDKPDRTFRVVNGQLGPWPQGHPLSEAEFRRRYPAPKEENGNPVDAEAWYAAAMNRLLGVGPGALPKPALSELPASEAAANPPQPAPVGPEQHAAKPPPNPLAALESLAQQQLAAAQQPTRHEPAPQTPVAAKK